MAATATVRVMSPEEIAAQSGGETPFLLFPTRETVFAERAMRLRQRAAGHPMGDFLRFMADLCQQQQDALAVYPAVPVPDAAALDEAARRGEPPLPAADGPRDAAWRASLRTMLQALAPKAPPGARAAVERVATADDSWLDRQADCLLTGVTLGLDMAAAPLVGAGLQVAWTHLLTATQAAAAEAKPFGRIDDKTVCPCCGSRPVASITRTAGEATGQRYLHCSLCNLQWHMVRIQCTHCLSTKSVAYQSLQAAGAEDGEGAASAAVQAETCDDCGHYLKILHSDRDPLVEPVADDLATLTLDLLVAETGKLRHGVNLMLLFGDPQDGGAGVDPPAAGQPDPGGA